MNPSLWQFDFKPWYGWSISTILHLLLIIAVSLLLMPSGDGTSELLEVEVTFADIGADIVELDTFTAELDSLEEEVAEDDSAVELFTATDPLTIEMPLDVVGSMDAGASGGDGSSTAGREGHSGGAGQTSFFGTVAQGNSFVYILDVSPSMNARSGRRLQRAVRELLQSLDNLRDEQRFYVVVFGWNTRLMFDGDQLVPRPIPATLRNKQRFRKWLAAINTIPGTDPRKSLDVSLAMNPSAIFFLSDGEFNKPASSPFFTDDDTTAEDVINGRKSTSIPIHTVAFEDPICEPRMEGIAKLTNGQHRFVPAPEEDDLKRPKSMMRQDYIKAVREFAFRDEGKKTRSDPPLVAAVDTALASRAAYSLQLAKMLQDTDKGEMALRMYERVVRQYPNTPAAHEASATLEVLKKSSIE